jgi:hypothetical protein
VYGGALVSRVGLRLCSSDSCEQPSLRMNSTHMRAAQRALGRAATACAGVSIGRTPLPNTSGGVAAVSVARCRHDVRGLAVGPESMWSVGAVLRELMGGSQPSPPPPPPPPRRKPTEKFKVPSAPLGQPLSSLALDDSGGVCKWGCACRFVG